MTNNTNKLYSYIRGLNDFLLQKREINTYNHIGATIIDTILQSGLNYENVVLPRVNSFLNKFPEHRTTKDFHFILSIYDLRSLIRWRGHTKINRIYKLKNFLLEHNISTEDDLNIWLKDPKNEMLLYKLKGIGSKTIDYLKILVGIQTIAIDRHIKNFVNNAGLTISNYNKIKIILLETSKQLNIDPISLDYSIWIYMKKNPSADWGGW